MENMDTFTFRISNRDRDWLKVRAEILHLSVSEAARIAINHFLNEDHLKQFQIKDRYLNDEENRKAENLMETKQEEVERLKREIAAIDEQLKKAK